MHFTTGGDNSLYCFIGPMGIVYVFWSISVSIFPCIYVFLPQSLIPTVWDRRLSHLRSIRSLSIDDAQNC
jgi:hypothetical protein